MEQVSVVRLLPSRGGRYSVQGVVIPSDPETAIKELRERNLRLMVVANIPDLSDPGYRDLSYKGLATGDDIKGLTYALPGQPDLTAIPMWGVCTPTSRA